MENKNIYIQNYWYVNNYGACLTAYALYNICTSLGFNTKLIDNSSQYQKIVFQFGAFFKKYCKSTKQIRSYNDLKEIDNENNIYLIGSDQVLRPKFARNNLSRFLLEFANIKSKKIAMSASFGIYENQFIDEVSEKDIKRIANDLRYFDSISVREKSGTDICKNQFNIDAQCVIDPVFMIQKTKYDELISNAKEEYKGKIVSYIIDRNENHKKAEEFLSEKYDLELVRFDESGQPIENWLSAIKNCKFLITNSFHGTCFAILFNKPFICMAKEMCGSARFDSIFELLDINPALVNKIDDIYTMECINYPNYVDVNKKIEFETKKGCEFLKTAIDAQKTITEDCLTAKINALETLISEQEVENKLENQIKKILWEKWLIIYYKFLPKSIKQTISYLWHLIRKTQKA